MSRIILDKEEMRRHLIKVAKNPDVDMCVYYTQKCIRKYSKEEQDEFEKYLFKTILEVDGGYWQIVENMDYMPTFESHRRRSMKSYTKGNVPKGMAKRELSEEQYAKLYK
jgi:hypothetical protein